MEDANSKNVPTWWKMPVFAIVMVVWIFEVGIGWWVEFWI